MKALEYLKKEREIKKHYSEIAWVYHNKSIEEAIKELEDLNNRSCATCKYGCANNFEDDVECENFGADTQGLYFKKDFYCKYWELK